MSALIASILLLMPVQSEPPPGGGGGGGSARARLQLIAETAALVPGETVCLGVHFEIDPGWHLYWNGLNDSGMPPELDFTLPHGFQVGEALWPAPKRHVSPGDIVDYIYEKRVTLLVPLIVPESARPGDIAEVSIRAKWLVCSDVCLPGEGEATLKLPISRPDSTQKTTSQAPLFAEARARLPRALPTSPDFKVSWQSDTLVIQVSSALGLDFLPDASSAMMTDRVAGGRADSARLVIKFQPAIGHDRIQQVSGILEVSSRGERGGRTAAFYSIKVSGPETVTQPR